MSKQGSTATTNSSDAMHAHPSRPAVVRLAFVGDICLDKSVRSRLGDSDGGRLFGKVRHLLDDADLAAGNLECVLVPDDLARAPGHGTMTVPSSLVGRAALEPFAILGLANNHVMDAGVQGLATTKAFLDREHFSSFGAGGDIVAAEAGCILDVQGIRIAFLGACDVGKYHAADARPGVAPLNPSRLVARVRAAKEKADLVILVLHADIEFTEHPSPSRVRLSRHLVDAGADAVIQHHPHVCQGVEVYRDRVIAYSLGNFVFPVSENAYMRRHGGTRWGMILYLDVEPRKAGFDVSCSWEPVTIGDDDLPQPSAGSERQAQIEAIRRISADLADGAAIRRYWWQRCVREAKATFYVLAHLRRKSGILAVLRGLIELLRDPYERRWMYGLVSGGVIG